MTLAPTFNALGQKKIPEIFGQHFPDLMSVTGKSGTSDGAGGTVKGSAVVYDNVPCFYEPTTRYESQQTINDAMTSFARYTVTFATHLADGTRLSLNPETHRLTVKARGGANGEPAKTFRIISVRDNAGLLFEAVCEKEN